MEQTGRRLIELKNLGAGSVNVLNAIGVRSLTDLAAIGSVQAYRRILQHGIHVSPSMLYAMEAALQDISINAMDAALKMHLEKVAERIEQEENGAQAG